MEELSSGNNHRFLTTLSHVRAWSFLVGVALCAACSTATQDKAQNKNSADAEAEKSSPESSDSESESETQDSQSTQETEKTGSSDPKMESSSEQDPGDENEDDDENGGPKFDLGIAEDSSESEETTETGPDCEDIKHKPCDQNSDDLLHAMGINCPGEVPQIDATFRGAKKSRGVFSSVGSATAFPPREGEKYLVLGTGDVSELSKQTPKSDKSSSPRFCNSKLSQSHSFGQSLPEPIKTRRVGLVDCIDDPTLVGTGDCSNTIQAQWNAALNPTDRANDYSELRLKLTVPDWAKSLSFDFGFGTVEYPSFYGKVFNDLFIAWLESKSWTGNISFDKNGNPISLNAGFLDYRDAQKGTKNDPDCLLGCKAPEIHGSCLEKHAATKWLTTTVGVTPGEKIELIFAIMDLGDGILDSHVLLDNFVWGCEQQEKPETDPPK